jgi:hypothetical protein
MQEAECKMQNAECKVQNAKWRMQSAECKMQNANTAGTQQRGESRRDFHPAAANRFRSACLNSECEF